MAMLSHPAVLLFLTVTVYWITNIVRARTGSILCNPVVLSATSMIVYLKSVKPRSADEVVDEMLALMSDRDRWVKKKEAEYCNEKNNEWMNRKKDQ